MPIYEYVCSNCGETFEKRVSFAEADQIPACPKCSSSATHKKISIVGSLSSSSPGASSPSSSSCGSRGGFS
ncbi:MAG TPA: zinc ribbon domain-containing protein [Anaerolineaceae bacterium]|nr:zinc ribbon domain-containing protein [Anaerolineaceae bacterium]